MSSFLSEAVARRCPVEKVLLKFSQNSLNNICDAVLNLIKLQAKGLQHYWKETPVYVISQEFCRTTNVLRTNIQERRQIAFPEISSKIKNSSTG